MVTIDADKVHAGIDVLSYDLAELLLGHKTLQIVLIGHFRFLSTEHVHFPANYIAPWQLRILVAGSTYKSVSAARAISARGAQPGTESRSSKWNIKSASIK
jgi:hypothetical protein